ncbi:efflux RND transporter periplasmic adaptor subunit [Tropicimonas isoalkanivorans]|uniref:HlyD family secretion protein n=1 Tax=Tropicimonas isoalkanivorans TaxID=441112 RepID=A0A1I1N643_9RHOB|nr:HlyD family efflux transporter periplasmic adaptor subunit [Tropicimonas isoalkanivorans]SFC92925.1 HlyD family secretion protein [Tropicimonas isoalkanivorans]
MQFLRRSLTGLFLLSMTVGLLAYGGRIFYEAVQERMNREVAQRPASERVLSVNSVEVVAEDVVPIMVAFGEIQSRRTLEVRAGAGGRIVELSDSMESGARVEAGALLARVDPNDAEAALEVARTDVAEAEAELRDALRNLALVRDELAASRAQADLRTQALKRQQDLAGRGVGTEAAIEEAALAEASANQAVVSRRLSEADAENRLDVARNALARARIAFGEAQRDLEDTEVRAAFSGTLADVSVVEGGLVTQNERLATLIDPESLEVAFRVSTSQYARLLNETGRLIGAPVRVTLDVLGVDLEAFGLVSRVDASVGEGQTGRLLFARLDRFAGFRPGDFVTVHVEEPELSDVAVLPATALDAANTLLVINEDARLETARVDLLRRQGDDVIVAAAGLEGRRVVAERSPLLGTGIRVKDLSAEKMDVAASDAAVEPEGQMITLSPDRRAALIAAVEANGAMPADAKARILSQLQEEQVPAQMVERIESRMGG